MKTYVERREKLDKQCREIVKRMLRGERLTMRSAIEAGIGDIRRRAKDLIDYHQIPVCRERAVVDNVRCNYKWYYIHPDDRLDVAVSIDGMLEEVEVNVEE